MRGISRAKAFIRHLTLSERPIVLMYHRVAELACDPWQLAVSPQNFADQLSLLVRERKVVSLGWLAEELRQGRLPARSVALTFDDGYADVFHTAKPILEEYGCSATIFLTTGALDARGFWWDVLSRILLETSTLPPSLTLEISRERHVFDLGAASASCRVTGAPARGALHYEIWKRLRPLPLAERDAVLERLAAWAGVDASPRSSDRAMTYEEAQTLAASPLIDIGAHTITHPSLPLISDDEKTREILESRIACQNLVGTAVTGFAYPFGDLDAGTIAAARKAGMGFACTTETGVVTLETDLLKIPRVLAADWKGDEFRKRVLSFC